MFSSELSDEHVLHLRSKWTVSERVLEPLEMSDTEILDFFGEYCATARFGYKWTVVIDAIEFTGANFREAVGKAGAYSKEVYGDF